MPPEETEPTRTGLPRQMPLTRQVMFWGFAGLAVLAVVFFFGWGLTFGVWFDNGVYAVTITLLLFGLAGMWLMLPDPPVPAPPP
jgi:type VI protein secretion system component VasF